MPQIFVKVNRDKVLKQGVPLNDVYRTLQTFMGGYFVNYFNRFGRQWQVYIEAEDEYRARAENIGLFYVRNNQGQSVPLSAFTEVQHRTGPEFIMHYNEYPCAQINGSAAQGYSSVQANRALEEVFAQTMPPDMGFDYFGMSFQEKQAARGRFPGVDLRPVSPVRLSDPRRPIRKLVPPLQCPAGHANRHPRRLPGPKRAGAPEQRLCANRADHAHRPRREECHPHRRLCEDGLRTRPIHHRRGADRRRHAVAAHSDDLVGLHPRLPAAMVCRRLGASRVKRWALWSSAECSAPR